MPYEQTLKALGLTKTKRGGDLIETYDSHW